MKPHSEAFLRKRKVLLMLPLLVLPFLTWIFWVLGGGNSTTTAANAQAQQKGLNLQLPEAQLQQKQHQDKLSYYNQVKQKTRQLSDAGTSLLLNQMGFRGSKAENQFQLTADTSATTIRSFADPPEVKINQKLAQLEKVLQPSPEYTQARQQTSFTPASLPATSHNQFSQEVGRLESMMQQMSGNHSDGTADPQMQQLENMLERILDIQHPERVKQRMKSQTLEEKQQIFTLQASAGQTDITLLEPAAANIAPTTQEQPKNIDNSSTLAMETSNAFHELQDNNSQSGADEAGNVLEAVIHQTRVLTAGATIKMRLLQEAYLGGRRVEKGSLIYGTCRVNGERLHIEVTSVLFQNTLLPVALAAFDLDGQEGLYIPGALTRDAAKQGADRAVNQSLQLSTLNPSIGAQAARAGIEAAKGLLSRQARQIKVTVKAGHRLLLCDQSTRQ